MMLLLFLLLFQLLLLVVVVVVVVVLTVAIVVFGLAAFEPAHKYQRTELNPVNYTQYELIIFISRIIAGAMELYFDSCIIMQVTAIYLSSSLCLYISSFIPTYFIICFRLLSEHLNK
jgi:hypothetical protein